MSLRQIRKPDSILKAVAEFDKLGRAAFLRKYGFRKARSYFLTIGDRQYDSKAVSGAAHGYEFPDRGPLRPSDFSGGDATVRRKLEDLGFRVAVLNEVEESKPPPGSIPLFNPVDQEREERLRMWTRLLQEGGPQKASPGQLRDLRIYGGAQGIWVDKARTGNLSESGSGITVSVLHTGSSYADDLSDDAVLYHYPKTGRPRRRDLSEIIATKETNRLGVPIFVITYPSPGSSFRNVSLGWVENWDDEAGFFLISLGEIPSPSFEVVDEGEFRLTADRKSGKHLTTTRRGQQRFKFGVFKRYGHRCAVCDLSVSDVLEAAHMRPKEHNGSDDPRNGLVLCATHHRAFDAGLFAIEPQTLSLMFQDQGPTAKDLAIHRSCLQHLSRKPHSDALEWRWKKWNR